MSGASNRIGHHDEGNTVSGQGRAYLDDNVTHI